MPVGYPLPEDICPDNEYEAWYHAINSLVNFVTSMTQLAVCYSNRLQQCDNVSQESLENHPDKEKCVNEPFNTSEEVKIFSRLNEILEDIPFVAFPKELPHGEPSQEPRTFSLIDTTEFGDARVTNSDDKTKSKTFVPVVKSEAEKKTNDQEILITSNPTIKPRNSSDLKKDGNVTNQIPQTESNGTYFSQYSTDSNQTVNSLNLQENYETIEDKSKIIVKCALNKDDQLRLSSMKKLRQELETNINEGDTKALEICSQEIEQVCFELDKIESQNSKKNADLIEQNPKSLQISETKFKDLSQSKLDSFNNNNNFKGKNYDITQTKLSVPEFAMNPTPKRMNNFDDKVQKIKTDFKEIKKQTTEFNEVQQKSLNTKTKPINHSKKIPSLLSKGPANQNDMKKERNTKETTDTLIVKNNELNSKKNVPKPAKTTIKEHYVNPKEGCQLQDNKKHELQKGKVPGFNSKTFHLNPIGGGTVDLNTRIPIRFPNKNASQGLPASVGQVDKSKADCGMTKKNPSEPKTPHIGKSVVGQKLGATKKVPLATCITMKITEELAKTGLIKTDEKKKNKRTRGIDKIRIAAAENIRKADKLLERTAKILE